MLQVSPRARSLIEKKSPRILLKQHVGHKSYTEDIPGKQR